MAEKTGSLQVGTEEEVDTMAVAESEYNEKIFLSELEESLKEMRDRKDSRNSKVAQPSWRDLFNMDEE